MAEGLHPKEKNDKIVNKKNKTKPMGVWRPLNEGMVNGGQTGGYCPGIGHFIATNEQQIDFGQVGEGTSQRLNKK